VFGYFRVAATPGESHVVTQHRVVTEHLAAIRDKLIEISAGRAVPLDTAGRHSAVWGQPWLTAYLRMRRRAAASLKTAVENPRSRAVSAR
jgi:hypothetical protein